MDALYKKHFVPIQKHKYTEESLRGTPYLDAAKVEADLVPITLGIYDYQNLIFGFYNGTRFYGGPNSKICQTSISNYIKAVYTDIPAGIFPAVPLVCNP